MDNENIIYWKGVAVGYECGDYDVWFPSAPRDAIEALKRNSAPVVSEEV